MRRTFLLGLLGSVGGLLLHGSSIYATRRGELLEIPWPD